MGSWRAIASLEIPPPLLTPPSEPLVKVHQARCKQEYGSSLNMCCFFNCKGARRVRRGGGFETRPQIFHQRFQGVTSFLGDFIPHNFTIFTLIKTIEPLKREDKIVGKHPSAGQATFWIYFPPPGKMFAETVIRNNQQRVISPILRSEWVFGSPHNHLRLFDYRTG